MNHKFIFPIALMAFFAITSCVSTDNKNDDVVTEETVVAETENANTTSNQEMEKLAETLLNNQEAEANSTSEQASGIPIELNSNNFNSVINSKVALVDFYATWCRPCMMMKPVLTEFAKDNAGKIVVGTLDTDKNQNLAALYNISSIPCLIVFQNGKEVRRLIGYKDIIQLTQELAQYLK